MDLAADVPATAPYLPDLGRRYSPMASDVGLSAINRGNIQQPGMAKVIISQLYKRVAVFGKVVSEVVNGSCRKLRVDSM